jgi:hypothetical protein
MKVLNSKVCAANLTNAVCGLHNGKYTKYQPIGNCGLRACIESLMTREKFGISERKVYFFKRLEYSRNPSFSYFSHCVRQCTKYVNSRVRQLKKLYVPNWLDGEQTSIYGFTWTNSILFGMHSKLFLLEGEKSICVIFFPHNLVISICQR